MFERLALNPRLDIGLVQARGQVEPVGLAGGSDAAAQKDQEQRELRFIRAKSKESSDGADQQSSQAVSLSALGLEPNLKQFQKVDGEAQGTGAEVKMRHKEWSRDPTVLSKLGQGVNLWRQQHVSLRTMQTNRTILVCIAQTNVLKL